MPDSTAPGRPGLEIHVDPVTMHPGRPDGAGMYLHWDGRRGYRTRIPAPRVLEPVDDLSSSEPRVSRVIEGDNLQVMVSLRSQYQGEVDVAYLDPPYNTGKSDFAYSDRRFHDPNADADDEVYVSNEDGGRHTKWLNYMGPRLWLVWQLLADHGVCFVSINDIELFRLGLLMDEIFGERNRIGVVVWKQMADNNPTRIAVGHEYVLCYAKRIESVPPVWAGESEAKEWILTRYEDLRSQHDDLDEVQTKLQAAIKDHVAAYKAMVESGDEPTLIDLGPIDRYKFVDERGVYAAARDTAVQHGGGGYFYDVVNPQSGKVHRKPGSGYRFPEERMRRLEADGRIIYPDDAAKLVQLKKYLRELKSPLRGIVEVDSRKGGATLKRLLGDDAKRFPNPKPVELIEQLLSYAADTDSLILDPYAGSGTTGHAVMRLNAKDGGARRFILIEEGNKDDRYCRTILAPRLTAAIEDEGLAGGFTFEEKGRRLNREAIVELERAAITNLIIQTDATGRAQGIKRINGNSVIGSNPRHEAICLCWQGRSNSTITRDVLVSMFEEAKALGLKRPLRVYGSTCEVGETESFRFCQIPDEILAALRLEDEAENPEDDVEVMERLEAATMAGGSHG